MTLQRFAITTKVAGRTGKFCLQVTLDYSVVSVNKTVRAMA